MTAVDRYSANSLRRLLGTTNSVVFKDEIGEVEYFGQKVIMLRSDAFQLLSEELEKRHAAGTGKIILSIVGRRVGAEEGKALMSTMRGGEEGRHMPTFIQNAVEESNMGYGKLEVTDLDLSTKTVTVSTLNSFESQANKQSSETTCIFLLGYIEGLFSELFGVQVRGTETSCRSKGDMSCDFKIGPNFQKSKWKL